MNLRNLEARQNDNLVAALRAHLAIELPGIEFNLEHETNTMQLVLSLRRRVEAVRTVLADEMMMQRQMGDIIGETVGRSVEHIRAEAIRDYGLEREIEKQAEAAATKARKEQKAALMQYLEKFREEIPTLNADGKSTTYVPGELPREIAMIASWAERLA